MRNRIVSFQMVKPAELTDHPQNWREHPNTQRAALREVLERIGIADVILAYKSPKTGKLTILDGHLRREMMTGEQKVPVVLLDLNDTEAQALLASHDSVGAMALRNEELYEELLAVVEQSSDYQDIVRMLDADGWTAPEKTEEDDPFDTSLPADYPIAAQYDEGYDALIVTTATEAQWGQLKTLLGIPRKRDRRGRVGTVHVLTFEEFMKRWHAREDKPGPKARKARKARKKRRS